MEKSRLIREKMAEQEKQEEAINEDFRMRCAPELTTYLTNVLEEQVTNIDNVIPNGVSNENETSEQRVQRVRDLLKNGEFETVARYIIKLDEFNAETRKTMATNEQVMYFIVLLNSYLFDDYVSSLHFGEACQMVLLLTFNQYVYLCNDTC